MMTRYIVLKNTDTPDTGPVIVDSFLTSEEAQACLTEEMAMGSFAWIVESEDAA